MRFRGGSCLAVVVLLTCAGPLHAEAGGVDQITARLRGLGFRDIEVTRTLLGRVQIVADGARGHREIVLDPRTGEILRDISREDDDKGSGSGGRSGSDDKGDDGHGDDHDDGGDDGGKDGSGRGGGDD